MNNFKELLKGDYASLDDKETQVQASAKTHILCGAGLMVLAAYVSGIIGGFSKGNEKLFGLFSAFKCTFTTSVGRTIFIILAFIIVLLVAFRIVSGKFLTKIDHTMNFTPTQRASKNYGDSKLISNEADVRRKGFAISDSPLETSGTILGKTCDTHKVISIPPDMGYNRNMSICGTSGTGKSNSISKPWIMHYAMRGESMIVTDPKSELYEEMSYYLRKMGYKVYQFNTNDQAIWNSNSIDVLEEAKNADILERETIINIICHTIIANTTVPGAKAVQLFEDLAESLLKALVFYVVEFNTNDSKRTLGEAYKYLLTKNLEELKTMFESINDVNSKAKQNFNNFLQGEKFMPNAFVNLTSRMGIFQSEIVQRMTGTSDICIADIPRKKTAIFLITSVKTNTYTVLQSVMISLIFHNIMTYAESRPNRKCDIPVNFLLDEFPALGYMEQFKTWLQVARSYNMSIVIMFQDLSLLMARYGNNEWEDILAECDFTFYLGCNDIKTSEYYSKLTGQTTIRVETRREKEMFPILNVTQETNDSFSVGEGQRPLIYPDQLRRLDRRYIVMFLLGQTYYFEKFNYYTHPAALMLRTIKADEIVPLWRIQKNGTDLKNNSNNIDTIDMVVERKEQDENAYIIKSNGDYGDQRTPLIEQLHIYEQLYADDSVFPCGLPFLTDEGNFMSDVEKVHLKQRLTQERIAKRNKIFNSKQDSGMNRKYNVPKEANISDFDTSPYYETENDMSDIPENIKKMMDLYEYTDPVDEPSNKEMPDILPEEQVAAVQSEIETCSLDSDLSMDSREIPVEEDRDISLMDLPNTLDSDYPAEPSTSEISKKKRSNAKNSENMERITRESNIDNLDL